jgi:hypothetical protein
MVGPAPEIGTLLSALKANGDDVNRDPLNERGSNAVHRTGVKTPGLPFLAMPPSKPKTQKSKRSQKHL